jgi:lipid kinase YegS
LKKLAIILNGKSCSRDDVRLAVQRLRTEGCQIDVHVTWEGGDAARFARRLAEADERVVVAGGGDGTVHEVVGGLIAAQAITPLAILPMGTANDFATSVGLAINNPYEALRLAALGTPHLVDVGLMNGHHFLNVAVGGIGAEVTTKTPNDLKKAIGGNAYALTALLLAMKAHPYRGRLVTPHHQFEGSSIIMAVGNGRQAGGGVPLTPKALIDDGLLDVMVVPDHDHARFAHLLSDIAELRHGMSPHFQYFQLSQFHFESEETLQVNLDGEPVQGKRFEFGVLPRALNLILPEACSLLR